MNVLKLVDFALLLALSRRLLGREHVTLACSVHHEVLLQTSIQVCVGLEVVLLVSIVKDCSHGTLTDTLSTLILSLRDLPLDLVSVVMLNLLKPDVT